MKVAHLTTVDLTLRFLLLPQLKSVVDSGGEAVGISAAGPWTRELEDLGIRHVPLSGSTRSMSLRSDLAAMRSLWQILCRESPDVLHTHNPKPGVYGRILGRLAGVPIVVNTVHGLYASSESPWWKRVFVYALEGLCSRFSHAELVQSREDLDLMTKWRIAPPDRIQHLGNGVDLNRFDPGRFDRDHRRRVRDELGVDADDVLVGTVGRLVVEKGYLELFEAMKSLGPNFRLLCIGPEDPEKDDALDPEAIESARQLGVLFTGMRSDIDALYAAMDIFALASHREGFPRAAMEASAMGLPVVATDIRGCREVVVDGVTGLLVPLHAGALARAIGDLGADRARRSEMSEAGRRRAVELFDEQRVVATVMNAYQDVSRRLGLDLFDDVATDVIEVRDADSSDVPALAGLHAGSIDSGFLPLLGRGFMQLLYRALAADSDAKVLVADDGRGPVGFVAGVLGIARFYRNFLIRWGVPAFILALPNLWRPSVLRRAWETLRYGGSGQERGAELLAMAVAREARGRGLGTELGNRFLQEMSARGAGEVRVVVGADNQAAIAAYRRMGFGDDTLIEVHSGHQSLELKWHTSASRP